MLTVEEVARLDPHFEQRRMQLDRPVDDTPSVGTYYKIRRHDRIQRRILPRIDEVLDWPPGTALALAEGRISAPQLHRAPEAAVTAADRETLYVIGSQVMAGLPNATPDQLQRVHDAFEQARRALEERD